MSKNRYFQFRLSDKQYKILKHYAKCNDKSMAIVMTNYIDSLDCNDKCNDNCNDKIDLTPAQRYQMKLRK